MKRLLPLTCLLFVSCSGTRPVRFGEGKFGYSAVILRGRIVTPTGEIQSGYLTLNLESDAQRYRLDFEPGETTLLRIEPDRYRLHPSRNWLSGVRKDLIVTIAGRKFQVPFPRDILRKPPLEIKPTRVVPIGIFEARLLPIKKGNAPKVIVSLDDSIDARRKLVEDMVHKMMDPKTPVGVRSSAVSWTRALEQALVKIQGEEDAALSYKPSR